MKIVKIIALAATLVAGVSAANASPFNGMLDSFGALQSAYGATVLTVNDSEAKLIGYDNDIASVRARIESNRPLLQSIQNQGFTVDQIVGVSGGQNDLTLYAL